MPQARPVLNPTTVTLVDVGLSIIQVMSLVRHTYRMAFPSFNLIDLGRTKSSDDNQC